MIESFQIASHKKDASHFGGLNKIALTLRYLSAQKDTITVLMIICSFVVNLKNIIHIRQLLFHED
jgi:hypothetical protein